MEKPFAGNPGKFEPVVDEIVAFPAGLSPLYPAEAERRARTMRRCARHPGIAGRVAAIRRYEGRTPGLEAALSCRAYHGYLIEF